MRAILTALCLIAVGPASAGMVEVVNVTATPGAAGWRFEVMVLHVDKGWHDYADQWQIAAPDGTVLASQVVAEPENDNRRHIFAMNRVQIPDDIKVVVVSARDQNHGWGPGYPFTLPRP